MIEETTIKRGRGRPRKEKLSAEDEIEQLILKAYTPLYDRYGNLRFERNTTPLTADETALMIWAIEGKKDKKPLSKVRIIQLENQALKKIRAGLAKFGIKDFSDVYDARGRWYAKCADKVDSGYDVR